MQAIESRIHTADGWTSAWMLRANSPVVRKVRTLLVGGDTTPPVVSVVLNFDGGSSFEYRFKQDG